MASHMDLLAASRKIDQNIDPEAGHMLPGAGDFTSFRRGSEIMTRSTSTPDLLAQAGGMVGDDLTGRKGTADIGKVEWAHDDAPNENNERVRRRLAKDGRTVTTRPTNKGPKPPQPRVAAGSADAATSDAAETDKAADASALGADGKPVGEQMPPKPATVAAWKPRV